jgi:cytidyltransferase-like protein
MKQKKEGKIVLASGYFDPAHLGHIQYLQRAKELAGKNGKLIVIVNNDKQAHLKKGYEFMPLKERVEIVKALACVDDVFISIDEDKSVVKSIRAVHEKHGAHIFAKGGDRFAYEIPETPTCNELGIEIIHGLGDKIQSSSDLIAKSKEFENQKVLN